LNRKYWTRADVKIIVEAKPDGVNVVPRDADIYVLIADRNRRLGRVKDLLLKRLRTVEEFLAN